MPQLSPMSWSFYLIMSLCFLKVFQMSYYSTKKTQSKSIKAMTMKWYW